MKRFMVLLLCVAMLLCATACFKSDKKTEASEPTPSFATTAPGATAFGGSTTASVAAVTTTTAPSVASFGEFPCIGYTTDSLNVRRDPSTDYDAIGGLDKGDKVTIVGEEGDFYKIEWSSFDGNFEGKYAYVSKQYVSASLNAASPAATSAVPSATTTVPTKPVVQAAQ